MTQYIKIDTAQRNNPLTTTPSQCTVHSSSYVFSGKYTLAYMYLPITFFNVTTANNLLYFTDTAPCTATIPVGFYDSYTILAALTAAMNAASTSTVYAAGNKTSAARCMKIQCNTGTFVINLSNTNNSVATLLGFNSIVDTVASTVVTSDVMSNLSQVRSLNIDINGLSSVLDVSGKGSFTFVLPVKDLTPCILNYEPTTFFQTVNFERPTRDIVISVYDDNYKILSMFEDFFMILRPHHH